MISRLTGQSSGLFQRWLKRRIPAASHVRLNHRRIFIMPTRAGMGLVLLLGIMLIGAINYQNSLVYAVVFLLGSLFWVGLHHTYRNLAALELQAAGSLPVFSGEEAQLNMTLVSGRREHQAIVLRWPETAPRQVDVDAGMSTPLALYYPTEHRGWLKPGRLRVETRYPLGWFVAWSLVDLDWRVLVYPQPVNLPLPGLVGGGEGEGDQQWVEGVEDFQGLRDYQPGDSKKRLDWRAWSRGQGLHSKVFADPRHASQWLSLAQAPGQNLEQQLSCLTGWVLQLEQRRQPYGLELPGTRLQPAVGEAHQQACLRALALYGADE